MGGRQRLAREVRGFLLAVTCTETGIMPSTLRLPAPHRQPSLFLCLLCETASCLGLVGLSAPAPHPGSTSRHHCAALILAHTAPPPPTVCLGPQPSTCHWAVPPSHPLPPVSGRQLQLCPLLSEQVDSDVQSHKPWVGTSFFCVTFSVFLSSLLPLPLPVLCLLPSSPPASHISPISLFHPIYTPKFPE